VFVLVFINFHVPMEFLSGHIFIFFLTSFLSCFLQKECHRQLTLPVALNLTSTKNNNIVSICLFKIHLVPHNKMQQWWLSTKTRTVHMLFVGQLDVSIILSLLLSMLKTKIYLTVGTLLPKLHHQYILLCNEI